MAWNPSPKVADCRDIATKWGGKDQIIVLALDHNSGTLEVVTYGRTKELCSEAKALGGVAFDSIIDAMESTVGGK